MVSGLSREENDSHGPWEMLSYRNRTLAQQSPRKAAVEAAGTEGGEGTCSALGGKGSC